MPSIVTVNVSLLQAPTPSTLQKTGALISVGGTTTAANTLTLLTQLSDLAAILTEPTANSSLAWSGGTVTVTTAAPHLIPNGKQVKVTIAGVTPSAYNGTYVATSTGASTFTYALVSDPGSETVPGTWVLADASELLAMGTTFFAQGSAQAVYVLELGILATADAITALGTWLTTYNANPQTLYAVLVPREWDAVSGFLSLIASYESPTSKFYFWVTTTQANYTSYTDLMKDVIALVEAPSIPATEFSLAAEFYNLLNRSPSNTNKNPPFAFDYNFGVTPYPAFGNNTFLTQLKAAGVNYIATGAEGGISNTIFVWGTTMDKRDIAYWYSIDWLQINAALALANEVINGSNNPINPLYYDQPGINRLQSRLGQVVSDAIIFGLATGTLVLLQLDGPALDQQLDANAFSAQAVVNAVPFVPYATANPGDYKIGTYAGLSVIYIPARGFIHIILNIVASDFVTF